MSLVTGGLQSGGGGPASSLGPGATGTTLVLSGSSTALQYISTQSSGADAFLVTTNGARWHFGIGATDYASSDGTTVTFAGPVTVDGALNVTTGGINVTNGSLITLTSIRSGNSSFYGSSVSAVMDLVSFIASSVTTTSVPAIRLYPLNVLDATDLVLSIGDATPAALWSINYSGKVFQTADISYTSYTDDSATPGNRTVNKVRGKNAIAALASTCTITNSFVTANSQIICTLEFADATATAITCVIPNGTGFTITVVAAATANTKFSWIVIN